MINIPESAPPLIISMSSYPSPLKSPTALCRKNGNLLYRPVGNKLGTNTTPRGSWVATTRPLKAQLLELLLIEYVTTTSLSKLNIRTELVCWGLGAPYNQSGVSPPPLVLHCVTAIGNGSTYWVTCSSSVKKKKSRIRISAVCGPFGSLEFGFITTKSSAGKIVLTPWRISLTPPKSGSSVSAESKASIDLPLHSGGAPTSVSGVLMLQDSSASAAGEIAKIQKASAIVIFKNCWYIIWF